MKPEAEAAIERGRILYAEIFESPFAEQVLDILVGSSIDDILFAIFHDAVKDNFIIDVTDACPSIDGSPTYMVSARRLRTLMCAALTVGMWHQKITDGLDTMWGVDKTPEGE